MALRSPRASCRTAGTPTFHPDGLLTRSHSEYVDGTSLIGMIQEDQVAERVAIDSYREMIAYLGNEDPTTRRMLEKIAFSRVHSARPRAARIRNMPGRHVIMT